MLVPTLVWLKREKNIREKRFFLRKTIYSINMHDTILEKMKGRSRNTVECFFCLRQINIKSQMKNKNPEGPSGWKLVHQVTWKAVEFCREGRKTWFQSLYFKKPQIWVINLSTTALPTVNKSHFLGSLQQQPPEVEPGREGTGWLLGHWDRTSEALRV